MVLSEADDLRNHLNVHKCVYGNAPEYLRGLVKVKRTSRYNLRSDGGMLLEDYSAPLKKTL